MGFESSQVARRRLAAAAMQDWRVQDALAISSPEPVAPLTSSADAVGLLSALAPAPAAGARAEPEVPPAHTGGASSLALVLDALAVDILETPGAGGALLEAFGEQSRVLRQVLEALERAPDQPLPAAVSAAVRRTVSQTARSVPLPA